MLAAGPLREITGDMNSSGSSAGNRSGDDGAAVVAASWSSNIASRSAVATTAATTADGTTAGTGTRPSVDAESDDAGVDVLAFVFFFLPGCRSPAVSVCYFPFYFGAHTHHQRSSRHRLLLALLRVPH